MNRRVPENSRIINWSRPFCHNVHHGHQIAFHTGKMGWEVYDRSNSRTLLCGRPIDKWIVYKALVTLVIVRDIVLLFSYSPSSCLQSPVEMSRWPKTVALSVAVVLLWRRDFVVCYAVYHLILAQEFHKTLTSPSYIFGKNPHHSMCLTCLLCLERFLVVLGFD